MKFIIELKATLINSLLDATSTAYPHIMFWKKKAYATDGDVVFIKSLQKEFPKKVYIHRECLPRIIGGNSTIKVRIKDDVVHVRYGHNNVIRVTDPYNPSQFPDVQDLIKQEKNQEDDSLTFTIATKTLKSLAKGQANFITLKVHKSLTIGRWKDDEGNNGYFAQASYIREE